MNDLHIGTALAKITCLCITGISLAFIIINSLVRTGSNEYIWIEAEQAEQITDGLEIIEDSEASGGQAIVSKLRSHQTESYASYKLNVLRSGIYHIWARAFWPGGCENSYIIKINNQERRIGNDNLTGAWHWIPVFSVELDAGEQELFLWNDEINAQLDRLLLTKDPYYKPTGKGGTTDFFIDFEEELPTVLEAVNPKHWSLVRNDKKYNTSFYVSSESPELFKYSLANVANLNEFMFKCSIKRDPNVPNSDASLIFNYLDKENYYCFGLTENYVEVYNMKDGRKSAIVKYFQEALIDTIFHEYSIISRPPEIIMKKNGIKVFKFISNNIYGGNVGVGSRSGGIYFDNLINATEMKPLFTEIFFHIGIRHMLKGEKSLKWFIKRGNWEWYRDKGIMSLEVVGNPDALILTGKEYWKDYSFEAAIKLVGGSAGLCFYAQNESNNYLYRYQNSDGTGKLQLLKIVNGIEGLIQEKEYDLEEGNWYNFKVNVFDGQITSYIDGQLVHEARDTSYVDGMIGLWAQNDKLPNLFDDIFVMPSKTHKQKGTQKFEYEFEMRHKAGIDFCDWDNSAEFFKQKRNRKDQDHYVGIEKGILNEVVMVNKKLFKDSLSIEILNRSYIPKDVNANIYLYAYLEEEVTMYKLSYGVSDVSLLKNNKLLHHSVINPDRRDYSLSYINGEFIIKSKDKVLFNVSDKIQVDFIKLGIGYCGIGKAFIVIDNIKIDSSTYFSSL